MVVVGLTIKGAFHLALPIALLLNALIPKTAIAVDSSAQCKLSGQVIQVSGITYRCQRQIMSSGTRKTSRFVLVRIASRPTQPSREVTSSTTTAPPTSTTTTFISARKFSLKVNYEIIDTNFIRITWNQIPDVREYRICVDSQCSGPDSQKIWLTFDRTQNSALLSLPRGKTSWYWVHALLLPTAAQYDELDVRDCCLGTKWANAEWLKITNQ